MYWCFLFLIVMLVFSPNFNLEPEPPSPCYDNYLIHWRMMSFFLQKICTQC